MEISLALEINHHANIKLPLKSARDQPLPRWPTCLLKLRPVIGSLPLTLRGMTPAHCFKFGFCLEFKCRRPRVKIFVPTRGRLSAQRSPPCMGSRLTSSQDGWQFRSLIRVSPKSPPVSSSQGIYVSVGEKVPALCFEIPAGASGGCSGFHSRFRFGSSRWAIAALVLVLHWKLLFVLLPLFFRRVSF